MRQVTEADFLTYLFPFFKDILEVQRTLDQHPALTVWLLFSARLQQAVPLPHSLHTSAPCRILHDAVQQVLHPQNHLLRDRQYLVL